MIKVFVYSFTCVTFSYCEALVSVFLIILT